jgi:hypothetical protein
MYNHIEGLQVDFLANSYLYYIKNTSVIPDGHFDQICKWLVRYIKTSEFKDTKYYNLVRELGTSGSGYYLKEEDYPDNITVIAYKLLRQKEENCEIQLHTIQKELAKNRW